jgi:enterochelin esterase-like enzyme
MGKEGPVTGFRAQAAAVTLAATVVAGCGHGAVKLENPPKEAEVSQVTAIEFDTFGGFLDLVDRAADDARRQALVRELEAWLAKGREVPLIEGEEVVFLYFANAARQVTVPGDFNAWNVPADPMRRVEGTALWYLEKRFPLDARLDYKFHADGAWLLDPRNPRTMLGGFGPNSEVRMPGYRPPPEVELLPDIPHGKVESFEHRNSRTGTVRRISVYMPPGYEGSTSRYPALYVNDGNDYLALGQIDLVADYVTHYGRIPGVVVVCIPPFDRGREYALDEEYQRYVVEEVVPYVDAHYRTRAEPASRGILGASLGGLISVSIAYNHPEVFGLAAGQSSYFGVDGDRMITVLSEGPRKPVRWYLDVGTFESGGGGGILDQNRRVQAILAAKGYDLVYHEYPEGHSWGNWKAHIDDVLEIFWPGEK